MNIDSYHFGEIVISGKSYHSDVIVYKDRINDSWWRKEGHNLSIDDLSEVFASKPEILIIGTGASGMMSVGEQVKRAIEMKNIKLIVKKTGDACQEYNRLKDTGNVVAALHLTC